MDLGIDIGGSGIKGCEVDLLTGEFAQERLRIPTPAASTPANVIEIVAQIAQHFGADGPVGVTIPGVVTHGIVRTAANIDPSWVGFDAAGALTDRLGLPVAVLNDADAAGVAEIHYGAGAGAAGLTMLLTIGTGIGSALISDGVLVPNTELGHLQFKGGIAEAYASSATREREDLSWEEWALRFDEYLHHVNRLFSPDLIILGGGAAKKFDKYAQYFTVPVEVRPSRLGNNGGIVGAAWLAAHSR